MDFVPVVRNMLVEKRKKLSKHIKISSNVSQNLGSNFVQQTLTIQFSNCGGLRGKLLSIFLFYWSLDTGKMAKVFKLLAYLDNQFQILLTVPV